MKVLNFGSLNIDYVYSLDHFVQKGETISSDALHIFPGGKGLNQSVALGRAGVSVSHAGAVGKDGDFLLELLKESCVDTKYIQVLEGVQTGTAIIQNDKSGDNCIILYSGANHQITKEQIANTISDFEKGDFLVLQNEINGMDSIVRVAEEKGLKIVLNPSPMNEKILGLPLQYVDYFVLNEVEAAQILGLENISEKDGEKIVRELYNTYPHAKIVLTLGAEGSIYFDGEKLYRQRAYKTEVVDTTAAGDTFSGFFIAGILRGDTVEQAMDTAARAAGIAISRPGAAPSIPKIEEVLEFSFK
ncbi:ribokinase [Oribacterium parvum ACB1]|jgi:possible ribokinase|uniref:Ribokinase n=1 Tax=Oribacterium parvum ACB1 TaxID=796943 RepID=G9WNH9_9FIRM|nr:ribokinase [Oribacterium parvum]EHL10716.1 ribokinase [Oribacterium parvum ACB1]EJF14083.1 putative ribokinase [Oribacterium parvum ACB8]